MNWFKAFLRGDKEKKFFKDDPKRVHVFLLAGFWWIIPLFIASMITGLPPVLDGSPEGELLRSQSPALASVIDIGIFPVRIMTSFIIEGMQESRECHNDNPGLFSNRVCRVHFNQQLIPFVLTILFWGWLGVGCYELAKKYLTKKRK